MFPVFTSRALALTLSFLYAAVLVYSQPDLCLEDDLLIALQANREAAEEFCRADLQVPDIYNTYLATTLRRTATALVTTTITVSIPSALTVPSSTRTITLGPVDTTSLNEIGNVPRTQSILLRSLKLFPLLERLRMALLRTISFSLFPVLAVACISSQERSRFLKRQQR